MVEIIKSPDILLKSNLDINLFGFELPKVLRATLNKFFFLILIIIMSPTKNGHVGPIKPNLAALLNIFYTYV